MGVGAPEAAPEAGKAGCEERPERSGAMVEFGNLGSVVLLGREKTSYVEFL